MRIFFSTFWFCVLCFALILQLLDIFAPADFVFQHLHVTSNSIVFSLLILTGFVRLFAKQAFFSARLSNFLLVSCVITFFINLGMTIVEQMTYPNFIYSIFHVNYDKIGFLSVALGFFWLINQQNTFFTNNKKILLFIVPIIITNIALLMYLWPFDVLQRALREDGPIEYLQFVFLVVGGIFASCIFIALFRRKKLFLMIIYLFFALGLFFVAGEEISWGQRIFGIATPETLSEINRQHELTIHNISSVDRLFANGLIFLNSIAALGVFITAFFSKWVKRKTLFLFFPRWYYVLFFLPLPFYFFMHLDRSLLFLSDGIEIYGYLGVTLFMIENFKNNSYFRD